MNSVKTSAVVMLQEERKGKLSKDRRELFELLLQEKSSAPHPGAATIARVSAGRSSVPLSFPQQRLWFLNQLMPESSAFNIFKAVRLRGRLQVDVLERTLTEIQCRHESLRTTFDLAHGGPQQIIHAPQPVRLAVEHLESMEPADKEAAASRLAEAERVTAFDLRLGPLLRCRLLRLDGEDHVILLSMHHIISDGWSIALLLKEIMLLYEAFRRDDSSPLPELRIQYADFALWQRRQMEEHSWQEQLIYWKQKLNAVPATLDLTPDRRRLTGRSYRGALESISFPARLKEDLIAFSYQQQNTSFMTLLAGFHALLFRYTGQEHFTVGTPIANRRYSETEDLIGVFINTLVMRANCSGAPALFELLERTRQTCLEAYMNQDVPFEKVVEELNPDRMLNEQPLFQVMFTLRNEPVEKLTCPGLDITYLPCDKRTAMFPLVLSIHDVDNVLSCWMEYSSELFDASTVQRMLVHYRNLLMAMVAYPEKRISELDYLSESERQQVTTEWSMLTGSCRNQASVHQLFEAQAEKTPLAVALGFEGVQLTYADVNRRANQLANYLLDKGLKLESLVAVSLNRSLALPISLLAILKAGCAYLPLDPNYPEARIIQMLEDSRASLLISERSFASRFPGFSGAIIFLDEIEDHLAQRSSENITASCQPDRLAYVTYTSGSTGGPKGVAVTHRNIVRLVKNQNYINFDEAGAFLQLSPISFDAATFEVWGSLLNGGRLVIYSPHIPSLSELAAAIQKFHITALFLTTRLFQQMVDSHLEAFSNLHWLLTGGEVMPLAQAQRVIENLKHVRFSNIYGPTENTTFTCFYQIPDSHDFSKPVPIGFPIVNSSVYVLDREIAPVPVGVAGELYTGGEGVARGYFGQPALTAEKFVPDPFAGKPGSRLYRTGDRVRWLPDGALEFLGRFDEQVKIRGFRIEPAEIEGVLNLHEQVEASVIIPWRDTTGQKQLVAYYIGKKLPPTEYDLRSYLREELPEYMVPSRFIQINHLPLSASGKLNRNALPNPQFSARKTSVTDIRDLSDTEQVLISIWREVLGSDVMNPEENFFDLGGHSLLATQVLSRICAQLHVDLTLRTFFESPTIAGLAAVIEQKQENTESVSRNSSFPISAENQPLDALVEEIAQLSEEEAQSLLCDESN